MLVKLVLLSLFIAQAGYLVLGSIIKHSNLLFT